MWQVKEGHKCAVWHYKGGGGRTFVGGVDCVGGWVVQLHRTESLHGKQDIHFSPSTTG